MIAPIVEELASEYDGKRDTSSGESEVSNIHKSSYPSYRFICFGLRLGVKQEQNTPFSSTSTFTRDQKMPSRFNSWSTGGARWTFLQHSNPRELDYPVPSSTEKS